MSSPIIFEKGTRDFSTLGLGLLSDAIQATTTEELNGQFIFEMDYPVSGNNADLIKENRIIVVNSGHILKRQGFIIRQIVRKIDLTMTVYAEHVSYATLDVALAPIGTISGDAKTALENWKRMLVPAVDFTVDSDILTTNSTSIGAPEFETARQGLGGHTGSILDVWGGDYQFDNWHIRLLKQRGKSANAIIAYGRNLISFEQDTNIADTYTSVYPYYQENSGDEGNKTYFLPERTVDSEFVGKYPNPKVLMLDLSNKFKDVADYSENKLRNYALSYIQSNNIGVPKVNMKISTVDLSRATGGFSEDIDLGDTVNVYFEKLGITTSAKVIKAVWNVLSDDYDKFEIGARRASLTESISELATTADENANKALNQALVALQSADGKSTIYYLNSSDPWPTNPNENDTAFVKDGENSIMYRYMFNNDTGMFSWVKILDSMSADQIKQRVSDALESGKAHTDEVKQSISRDIATAKSQAASLASTAEANAKSEATSLFNQAQSALSDAKTDLTKSISSEASKAVAAANSQAQANVNQAKSDINDTINALSVGGRNLYITATQVAGYINGTNGTLAPQNSATKEVVSDYIAVLPNTAYTFQAWGSLLSGQQYWAGIGQYGSNKSFLNRLAGIYSASTVTTDVPNDYEKTTFTTSANTYFVRVSSRTFGNYRVKFEQGNMPTDWSTAPEDVVYDYTDKDNKIKQTFTQYQETNDRLVSKSQTDATTALGLVETKISKTEYDRKTGELSKTINDTKDTADKSLKTIADIQEADGKRDSRISEVEKTAGEIKQTVSDLTTAQGKQSGYISKLQQRADGFEATVTKVDNLSVGGRNLLLGTRDWTDNTRWNQENTVTKDVYRGMVIASSGSAWASPVYMMQNAGILQVGKTYTFSTYVRNTSDTNTKVAPYYEGGIVAPIGMTTSLPAHTDWMRVSITFQCVKDPTTSTANLRWEGQNTLTNGQIQFAGYKLEEGNLPTDWTPAPEDVDSATAKVKLTADEASAAVTKLTSADGIITKAQADIKLNADAISEKVSKTVYDQKNGELSRTINEAKDTTDRSLKTIGDYKTSNDERVKAAESSIERTAKAITEKVSQTDYDDYKSKLNTRFTKVETTADGASTTVGKLQTAVNNLGQTNRLLNSEFNPDYAAWTTYDSGTRLGVDNRWLHNGSNNLGVNRDKDLSNWGFAFQKVAIGQNTTFSFSVNVKINSMMSSKGRLYIHLRALDANGNVISDIYKSADKSTTINFEKFSMQNAQTPAGTTAVELAMGMYGGGSVSFNQPFFVLDSHTGNYVAGNYSNSDYLAQVKITADGISNFVRDSSGNISTDFQTALSKTSIITGSTLATSIQKQTSSQITSAITDNNGKIISLINQDSSGVQIAGKNIVLDGNTTVTGAFKVSQANIANGAIGTAQIGDAAITSAKIADLDVAKITGNVSNFIQSNWNGVFASTTIDNTGMSIKGGNTVTKFDTSGAHYSNSSGMNATYSFGKWSDSNSHATSATGLYLGATGSENAFINILGTNGSAALVLAGSAMDYGANLNVMQGTLNSYVNVNIRTQLHFKGNKYNSPSYIEINENNRTFNFFTGGGSQGGGNYFYFNQNVISAGTFSSTSVLSKKNVKSVYDEDALGEIAKTQLVNFEYKNRIGQNHVSPIIDDVNSEKEYYIPKTILGQDNEYVDMYSMISMAWKAIQQLNEKIGEK